MFKLRSVAKGRKKGVSNKKETWTVSNHLEKKTSDIRISIVFDAPW